MAAAASDPLVLATDAAEALVRDGVPFREAHERVAASVRDGSFVPVGTAAESVAAAWRPGPGGVREALAEARTRFGASLSDPPGVTRGGCCGVERGCDATRPAAYLQ